MSHLGRILGKITVTIVIVAAVAISVARISAQSSSYHEVENWAKLPVGRTWGVVNAVFVDRKGNVWALDRCGANSCVGSSVAPIVEFDPSGKVIQNMAAGILSYPHGLFVDKEGNIWVADTGGAGSVAGTNKGGQQVFKLSPEGKVLMTLGKAGVAGDGPDTFNAPSGVVVAPNGDIFVADGHGGDTNARIVKFSKDGTFIKAWGKKGSGPGEFDTPHSIAMDSKGRIFVADRGNNRVEIFDGDGKFLEEWKQFGKASGVFVDANDTIYVADFQSNEKTNPGFKQGIRIGSAKDGVVKALISPLGPEDKPTSVTEDVAADAAGNVYGAETSTRNLRKYSRN